MIDDTEFEQPLEDVINNYVLPNCGLQITPDVIDKSGVAIPLLLSKPGAGKTSILGQKCNDFNYGLLTIQPALKPIEEYSGIPQFRYFKFKEDDDTSLRVRYTVTVIFEENEDTEVKVVEVA